MAFGKHESYSDDIIHYQESISMILSDLKMMGYKNLTKEMLIEIFTDDFSIGRAVRNEINRILDIKKLRV